MTWGDVAFAVIKILAMGYVLSILFTQINNVIFLRLGNFFGWIIAIGVLVFLFWWACYVMGMDVTYPFWASVFVVYKKYPPELHDFQKASADASYSELYGISNGVKKYRLGLYFFIAASTAAWFLLYSEVISI